MLRWRQKILDLLHAVLEIFRRTVEVSLALLFAVGVVVGLQERIVRLDSCTDKVSISRPCRIA
jgi:hypothetical protein